MLSLIPTSDQFTIGIVNLPISLDLYGNPIKKINPKNGKLKYVSIPNMRYPFFELDSDRGLDVVKKAYKKARLPLYMHKTMRGYHFLSTVSMSSDEHRDWITPLIHLNPACPMVTLRIKPNKWVGEREIFNQFEIFDNNAETFQLQTLIELQQMITGNMIGLLQKKYYIVRYRMTGERRDL